MINPYIDSYFLCFPRFPEDNNKPPTLYSILNSIVNYDSESKTKIRNLAKAGRETIFDFDYPLSDNINKETFETNILNHYLMRRIGYETVTAFQIGLESKLNEIMPVYNKMFDVLFTDLGDVTIKEGTGNRETKTDTKGKDNKTTNNITGKTSQNNSETNNTLSNTTNTTTENISDRRNSELPQSEIENVQNASYLTDYNYDTVNNTGEDTSESEGNSTTESSSSESGTSNTLESATNENNQNVIDDNKYKETITHINNLEVLKNLNENIKNVYSLIYKDLDVLFYGLIY